MKFMLPVAVLLQFTLCYALPAQPDKSETEFETLLPVKSFGIFTIGKMVPNSEVKWLHGPEDFNPEYVTNIEGRAFSVKVCQREGRRSAVDSIFARPVELFVDRTDALKFYEMFKKFVDDAWDSSKGGNQVRPVFP